MNLISERLIYKKATESDRSNYLSWYTNETVMKFITGKALTEEEANARFEKAIKTNQKYPEVGFYSVKRKEDNTFIGLVKLVYYKDNQAEIGYGLMPEYWGNKYASEILKYFVNYSKRISKINELIAIVDPYNNASKKVLSDQSFKFYKKGFKDNRPTEYYKLIL